MGATADRREGKDLSPAASARPSGQGDTTPETGNSRLLDFKVASSPLSLFPDDTEGSVMVPEGSQQTARGSHTPTVFGPALKEIVDAIAQTFNYVSNFADQMTKAVNDGYAIRDKVRLEFLKDKLDRIKGDMTDINAGKRLNVEQLRDFIENERMFAPSCRTSRELDVYLS